MFDPNKIFLEQETSAEEAAKALYEYSRLDEQKKSFLAKLELEIQKDIESSGMKPINAEIERRARASDEYFEYIDGLASSKEKWFRAQSRYKNLIALGENRRTQEASTRTLINKGEK